MAKHGIEPVKAFTYASRSADQENAEGICELAQCWEAGVGCVAYEENATASLTKAADLGLTNALFYLGMICFDRGERGDEAQFEQAIKWFMKADEKGIVIIVSYKAIDLDTMSRANMYTNLSKMYEKGHGVKQDKAKCVRLQKICLSLVGELHREIIAKHEANAL
jgi:TPR repeat protein